MQGRFFEMKRSWLSSILAAAMGLCMMMTLMPASASAAGSAINVLLIGVDSAAKDQRGRSDTMMLVRVDPENGMIRMASFLRDLYVNVPGVGKTRLNAAYHYGGEALLKETIATNFEVSIDRTVTVGFSLLCDLVDEIGGIEVEITEKEVPHFNDTVRDYNADYGLTGGAVKEAGIHRLDGKQALCFSRMRKLDNDFKRTSRQQMVISALLTRMSQMSRWELLRIALKNLNRVETDLTFGEVASLAPMLAKLSEMDIQAAHVPFEGAYSDETVNGMMVLVPNLTVCRSKLVDFLKGS